MSNKTLVSTPPWRVFSVRGPDAISWLNGIVTSDLEATRKGRAVFGLLLTKHGKVQGELQFFGRDGDLWVAVSGGDFEDILATLTRYLVMEDAEIAEEPGAEALIVLDSAGDDEELLPLNWHTTEQVRLYVGERAVVAQKKEALLSRGATAVDIRDASLRYRLSLPLYGRDYTIDDNPHDSSLERRAVSWSKGCYLGQEVVCMQDMRGKAKRRLVRLHAPKGMVAPGEKVFSEAGEEVGTVTTVATEGLIARVKAPHFDASALRVGAEALQVFPLLA
jgi:hypothetical protein